MWSYERDDETGHEPREVQQHAVRAALASGLHWLELAANGERGVWYLVELSFRGASQLLHPG